MSAAVFGSLVPPPASCGSGLTLSPSTSKEEAKERCGSERRKEIRYATCDPAAVSWLDLKGLQVPGIIRDVSRNGLRIELLLPVSMGARLKITLRKRAVIFAVARCCRQTGDTYQVGAEIEGVYYPSNTPSASPNPHSTQPESGELARSIVRHHTSICFGVPDRLKARSCPAPEGCHSSPEK